MQHMVLQTECVQRDTKEKENFEILHISKSHDNESKSTPDVRVTKLITHVDTLQTYILMLE